MSIRKEDIPKLAPQGSWKQMPSDPMELFLLSKVDARTRVEELALLCARSLNDTIAVIEQLVAKGIIVFPGKAAQVSASSTSGTGSGENYCISAEWLVPLEQCDTSFLDKRRELPLERAQEFLRVYQSLENLNPFQLFDVDETATDRDVKRAYQRLTLRYHPDRYYGKDIGGFQKIVEVIFKAISDTYDLISTQGSRDGVVSAYGGWLSKQRQKDEEAQSPVIPTRSDVERREARRAQVRRRLKEVTAEIPQFTMEDLQDSAPDSVELSPEELLDRKKRHRRRFTPLTVKDRAIRGHQHLDDGRTAMTQGDWVTAASHFNMALSLEPQNEEIRKLQAEAEIKANEILSTGYLKAAKMEKDMRNFLKAAKLFSQAADITKSYEQALEAAACFSRVEEFARAKECALLAQKWNPSSPRPVIALARVYMGAGLPNRARTVLKEVLEKFPDNKEAQRLLREIR